MENKDNEKQEERQNYIYFIFTHGKTKQIKISISQEYIGADTPEKIEDKDVDESLSKKSI